MLLQYVEGKAGLRRAGVLGLKHCIEAIVKDAGGGIDEGAEEDAQQGLPGNKDNNWVDGDVVLRAAQLVASITGGSI